MFKFYSKISKKQICLLVIDILIIWFSIRMGYIVRSGYESSPSWGYLITNIIIYVIAFFIAGIYDFKTDFRKIKHILTVIVSIGAATLGIILIFYMGRFFPPGRGILLFQTIFVLVGILAWRIAYSRLAVAGIFMKRALIVGCGNAGKRVAKLIDHLETHDIEIIGFLDTKKEKEGSIIEGHKVFWQKGSLKESVSEIKPDMLIMAMRRDRYTPIMKDLVWCNQQGINIEDMTSLYERLSGEIPLKYIDDAWVLFSSLNLPRIYYKRIKRLIDVIISIAGLIISSPITIPVAIAIKVSDGGDIFYCQKRLGENAREFEVIKFRTMIPDAEKESGALWAGDKDPRITRIGRFIRRWRIDEIPQLLNVLKGDMSMVGPRPEREEFIKGFREKVKVVRKGRRRIDNGGIFIDYQEKIPYYTQRLSVKPGITGWAQVMYPYASSFEQSAKKLEYDMYYLKNMSLALDVAILLKTIKVVLMGKGK